MTLQAAGIPYYDPEKIIKYSHGYNVSDKEWIQIDGENYKFEEIEERAAENQKCFMTEWLKWCRYLQAAKNRQKLVSVKLFNAGIWISDEEIYQYYHSRKNCYNV